MTTATAHDAATSLIGGRNTDGGWGYYPAKTTRLEPTAWACLAMQHPAAFDRSGAAQLLARWPAAAGMLMERPDGTPNYAFHGLALLVMLQLGVGHSAGNAALVAALERVKGIALPPPAAGTQDNTLRAWPWIPGTFSWVEPTAWCLLALKQYARKTGAAVDRARIDEAERLLINRSCDVGGWNFGNADVLGQDLRPYIPTTAMGLLAMQDQRAHPVVQRSLRFLEEHATSEPSATALALTAFALRAYGARDDHVLAALRAQLPISIEVNNHAALAMAVCALDVPEAYAAFTI